MRLLMLWRKNSENNEKGGFVTIMSASSRNLITSSLLKSPSPFIYDHSKSLISTFPELFVSFDNVNILPRDFVFVLSNLGDFSSNNES